MSRNTLVALLIAGIIVVIAALLFVSQARTLSDTQTSLQSAHSTTTAQAEHLSAQATAGAESLEVAQREAATLQAQALDEAAVAAATAQAQALDLAATQSAAELAQAVGVAQSEAATFQAQALDEAAVAAATAQAQALDVAATQSAVELAQAVGVAQSEAATLQAQALDEAAVAAATAQAQALDLAATQSAVELAQAVGAAQNAAATLQAQVGATQAALQQDLATSQAALADLAATTTAQVAALSAADATAQALMATVQAQANQLGAAAATTVVGDQPTADVAVGALIYREEFARSTTWATGFGAQGTSAFVLEDQYVLVAAPGTNLWIGHLPRADDAYMEVQTFVQDCPADSYIALMFRVQANSGYAFLLSCDLRFWGAAILHTTADPVILAMNPIPRLNYDLRQPHMFGVLGRGSTMTMYLDGEVLGSVIDTLFREGQIGLYAEATSGTAVVRFDNLRVWSLAPEESGAVGGAIAPPTSSAAPAFTCALHVEGRSVDLRVGPDTRYAVGGVLSPGETVEVTGQRVYNGVLWWRVTGHLWVRDDMAVVEGDCSGVPVVAPAQPGG